MAWDGSRPVNWTQLVRSWLIYAGIMIIVFAVLYREQSLVGIVLGLLVSGPLYLAFGYVLAKFGYQRKTWSDLRADRAQREADRATVTAGTTSTAPRSRPAPTRRTGGGSPRPTSKKKRR
jgi:hypothetical protein